MPRASTRAATLRDTTVVLERVVLPHPHNERLAGGQAPSRRSRMSFVIETILGRPTLLPLK